MRGIEILTSPERRISVEIGANWTIIVLFHKSIISVNGARTVISSILQRIIHLFSHKSYICVNHGIESIELSFGIASRIAILLRS